MPLDGHPPLHRARQVDHEDRNRLGGIPLRSLAVPGPISEIGAVGRIPRSRSRSNARGQPRISSRTTRWPSRRYRPSRNRYGPHEVHERSRPKIQLGTMIAVAGERESPTAGRVRDDETGGDLLAAPLVPFRGAHHGLDGLRRTVPPCRAPSIPARIRRSRAAPDVAQVRDGGHRVHAGPLRSPARGSRRPPPRPHPGRDLAADTIASPRRPGREARVVAQARDHLAGLRQGQGVAVELDHVLGGGDVGDEEEALPGLAPGTVRIGDRGRTGRISTAWT